MEQGILAPKRDPRYLKTACVLSPFCCCFFFCFVGLFVPLFFFFFSIVYLNSEVPQTHVLLFIETFRYLKLLLVLNTLLSCVLFSLLFKHTSSDIYAFRRTSIPQKWQCPPGSARTKDHGTLYFSRCVVRIVINSLRAPKKPSAARRCLRIKPNIPDKKKKASCQTDL